ncbi:hypothetical protein TRFO_33787 [Tritrichomonas foetus]|uniref:Palmitoyltransferase n=1 Tax=Tritrichomonas foetus TaxID=1144522 RepID=A0A1J4JR54_9EUKA|nr:hypothetical protein TRFO_33787 [Tritrichomonas foetus]|eukprot:OHS99748.1 hypothetical protein TRFO_33787 [Tritrichomonas foetus]
MKIEFLTTLFLIILSVFESFDVLIIQLNFLAPIFLIVSSTIQFFISQPLNNTNIDLISELFLRSNLNRKSSINFNFNRNHTQNYKINFQSKQKTQKMKNHEEDEDNNETPNFPGFTVWAHKPFLCIRFNFIPSIQKLFIGHWEVRPFFPLVVLTLSLASFFFLAAFVLPGFELEGFVMIPFIFLFFIFYLLSYIRIITDGPGYFPFFWGAFISSNNEAINNIADITNRLMPNLTNSSLHPNASNDRAVDLQSQSNSQDMNSKIDLDNSDNAKSFTLQHNSNNSNIQIFPPETNINDPLTNYDDTPSGIISTDSQYTWAKLQRRPPRSILSKSARRIVIRPEHFCLWASSWIGKRNHKFFILFNFYGFLYFSLFFIYLLREAIKGLNLDDLSPKMLTLSALALFDVIMILVFLSFLISNLRDASINRTSWEMWNNIDNKKFVRSTIENFGEVFGSNTQMWKWLLPVSPWKKLNNEDLLQGICSYYDNDV